MYFSQIIIYSQISITIHINKTIKEYEKQININIYIFFI